MTTMWLPLLLAIAAPAGAGASSICPRTPHALDASPAATTERDYVETCERILQRIGGLGESYPSMRGMRSPSHHEFRVRWQLDDPAQPAGKRNARRAIFGERGYWFSLQFYRGEWRGAAMFMPIEFGDLRLWFDFGHDGQADEIAAVAAIIREERARFCARHACVAEASGIDHTPR